MHHQRHAFTHAAHASLTPLGSDRDFRENRQHNFCYFTLEKQPEPTVSLPSTWARRIQAMTTGNRSDATEALFSTSPVPKSELPTAKQPKKRTTLDTCLHYLQESTVSFTHIDTIIEPPEGPGLSDFTQIFKRVLICNLY